VNTENASSKTKVKFADWTLKWLEIYKKGMVKDNSYWGTYYNPAVKHLIPYFGERYLDEIKPMDLQLFFKTKGKTNALETLKKMKACLRAIFDTAVENDLCSKNPVSRNIKLKSFIEPIRKQAYTHEQFNTVMEFARHHKKGLDIMTLLETGISRSELLGLSWEDIDFINDVIYINQGTVAQRNTETLQWQIVTDGLKNQYRQRIIPISEELSKKLNKKPRTINVGGNAKKGIAPKKVTTEFVFHSPTGKVFSPDNWNNRVYIPFFKEMHKAHPEIPILHAHELRHTRATLWYEDEVNLLTIAYLCGWTDLKMLRKRYAHVNVNNLRKELNMRELQFVPK
jgi:integrase